LEQFHQVVDRHGPLEHLTLVLGRPADIGQKPEVLAELKGEARAVA
jgi:hypothetical protein